MLERIGNRLAPTLSGEKLLVPPHINAKFAEVPDELLGQGPICAGVAQEDIRHYRQLCHGKS